MKRLSPEVRATLLADIKSQCLALSDKHGRTFGPDDMGDHSATWVGNDLEITIDMGAGEEIVFTLPDLFSNMVEIH